MAPTSEEECDEAGFFWQVELEAGAAEDVLDHGLGSAGPLQEGQELLGFLRFLKHNRERGVGDASRVVRQPQIRSVVLNSTL